MPFTYHSMTEVPETNCGLSISQITPFIEDIGKTGNDIIKENVFLILISSFLNLASSREAELSFATIPHP